MRLGHLISWPITIASAAWLGLFAQTDMAAHLHGYVWPVVTPLTVDSVEPAMVRGVPGSRISGTAMIERAQCDYIDVSFRLVGSDRSVNVAAFFMDRPAVREPGGQQWEALMVGVPPHRLADTRGEVRHECGVFPVVSPFYLPDSFTAPDPTGATALCNSGAYSTSTGPGTCSGHGGVKEYLNDVES